MLNQNLVRLNISRLFCCIPLTVSVLTLSLPFSTTAAFSHHRRPMTTSPPQSLSQSHSPLPPPVAKKVEHKMELFNDVRIDNYYWLRDDSRSDPDVLSYLRQENDYTDSVMSGTKKIEDKLFAEIKGRIKEEDISAPVRKGPYYYYKKTLEGKEYVQYCRRLISDNQKVPSVNDTMPTGPDAPPEHVILDENIKAQQHEYYSIGTFKVSPNNKLVAYAEDTKGDEIYTVYVMNIETQAPIGEPLVSVTSNLEWAGDDALVYVTMDNILRPDKAWLHALGTKQSKDTCLYEEKDDTFSLDLEASENKKYLFVASESKTTRFNFYLDVSKPEEGLKVLTQRVDGIDTTVSHRGDHFFIKRRSDQFFNSEVVACAVNNTSSTTVLIPHRESVKIQEIQLFSDHLVAYERENGLPKIIVYHLPSVGEPLRSLESGQVVSFIDPVYYVDSSESEFSSSILRFSYSSLKTPPSVYDYDMKAGISVLKKIDSVLGGFDATKYVTERQWARASDGTLIPMSLVYRKDLVKLDGSDPLLLYGYGSYEVNDSKLTRVQSLKSDGSGWKRRGKESYSDSDDSDDEDEAPKQNDPYVMTLEERQEWRRKIRQVMDKKPDIQEVVDTEEKKKKMQKLINDYQLVVEEEDPNWPQDADGWGFSLGQFFDKITIQNKKKEDNDDAEDDDDVDDDKPIVWQDDNYIRPIKDMKAAEWEETVFKDISPLIILVHNRYRRPKDNEKIREELEKAVHIIWNCRLPSPRCVALDAVVETELVAALKVSVFPEVIFTKAGKILYRDKAIRSADEWSKIMAFFYYRGAKPSCLTNIPDFQENIPSFTIDNPVF